jgi:hypothetical protein
MLRRTSIALTAIIVALAATTLVSSASAQRAQHGTTFHPDDYGSGVIRLLSRSGRHHVRAPSMGGRGMRGGRMNGGMRRR